MKTPFYLLFYLLFFGIVPLFVACHDEDSSRDPSIRPISLETADYKRVLFYNTNGKVTRVEGTGTHPDGSVIHTDFEFFFLPSGKFDSCASTTGFSFKYQYENDHLVRTDEYIDGVFSRYHTFQYNETNYLTTLTSWQKGSPQGEWTPHIKSTYTYNEHGNLMESLLFYFDEDTRSHYLVTTFRFSNYDNRKNADALLNIMGPNPTLQFRKNNPGSMVSYNANGTVTSTETYSYEYSEFGYPSRQTTATSFPISGQTGSYHTDYTYDIR